MLCTKNIYFRDRKIGCLLTTTHICMDIINNFVLKGFILCKYSLIIHCFNVRGKNSIVYFYFVISLCIFVLSFVHAR
jgi:hypothetical protein